MTRSAWPLIVALMAAGLGCDDPDAPIGPPPIDAPVIDAPIDAPAIDASAIDAPAIDAPAIDAPIDAPAIDAPAIDAPAIDAPAIDAAAIDAPAIDAPAIDAPAIDAPAIDAPAIDAPAIDAPAIDAPAIDAPAIDAPAIDAAAIDAPGIDAPAIDAPAIDAAIDAPPLPPGPVTITTTFIPRPWDPPSGPPPYANIPVVVTRPDGSPGARGVTDAAGRITLDVEPGSWVSVVFRGLPPPYTQAFVKTVAGVEPGDHLAFFRGGPESVPPPPLGSFTYNWSAVPPTPPGIVTVTDGCGTHFSWSDPMATLVNTGIAAYCAAPGAVLYQAFNGDQLVSYAHVPSLTRVPGATYAPVTWQPPGALQLRVFGVPLDATGLITARPLIDNDVASDGYFHFIPLVPSGGVASANPAWPPPVNRALVTTSFMHTSGGHQAIDLWTNVATPLDIPAAPLPFITLRPVMTYATRTVSWPQTAGPPGDAVVIAVPHENAVWELLVPPGASTYTFPPLPSDLADVLPPPSGSHWGRAYIYELDTITSYRAFRNLPAVAHVLQPHEHGINRRHVSTSPGS